MDKTELVAKVAHLFEITGHSVHTSVQINHREIDVRAQELQGLTRKIVLIECADFARPVGVDKLQTDLNKLRAAQETLKERAIIMHVAKTGYTPNAQGYALDQGVDIHTPDTLTARLINFDAYIEKIRNDPVRPIILKEYQPTKITIETKPKSNPRTAIPELIKWLKGDQRWLTLLGDYGVGKSWLLKRLLYHSIAEYEKDPTKNSLPLFIPLQKFSKSFDQNLLITKH